MSVEDHSNMIHGSVENIHEANPHKCTLCKKEFKIMKMHMGQKIIQIQTSWHKVTKWVKP